MKKRLLIIVGVCLLVAILAGGITIYNIMKPEKVPSRCAEIINSFAGKEPVRLEDLTEYSGSDFVFFHHGRGARPPLSGFCYPLLFQQDEDMPIERLERIDKNTVCVVYKLYYYADVEGDIKKTAYVCVLFKREEWISEDKKRTGEQWLKTGEYYCFHQHVLSSDAYKDIQVGDSLQRVVDIDDSLLIDWDPQNYFLITYQLLSDGIMAWYFNAGLPEDAPFEVSEYKLIEKTFYRFGTDWTTLKKHFPYGSVSDARTLRAIGRLIEKG